MKSVYALLTATAVIISGVLGYFIGKVNTGIPTEKELRVTVAENEIREKLERFYEIAGKNDLGDLKKFSKDISASEYRYTNELGTFDKAQAFRFFEELEPEFISTGFRDLDIQVHGDMAIAKYLDVSRVKSGDVINERPVQFTSVWLWRNGQWRVAAEHSSFLLPDRTYGSGEKKFPIHTERKTLEQ